jgi:hypothetical protein
MKAFLLLIGLTATAWAGLPPPDALPWDSVWVQPADTTLPTYKLYFITKDAYLDLMLGKSNEKVDKLQSDLEAIKKAIAEKEKP